MLSARHWPAQRLIVLWIVTPVTLVALRWALRAGTCHGSIESREVIEMAGLWPPAFASMTMALGAVVGAVTLGWVTTSWVGGRRYRRERLAAETSVHRQVLM